MVDPLTVDFYGFTNTLLMHVAPVEVSTGALTMSYENVGQHGTYESAPGSAGPNGLRDENMGDSRGDAVDSTYSANNVKQVSFQRVRNLQGTGTTFFYTYGRNSQQEY